MQRFNLKISWVIGILAILALSGCNGGQDQNNASLAGGQSSSTPKATVNNGGVPNKGNDCNIIPNQVIASSGPTMVMIGAWCEDDGSLRYYLQVGTTVDASTMNLYDLNINPDLNYADVEQYNSRNQRQISSDDLKSCITLINQKKKINAEQFSLLPTIQSELQGEGSWPPFTEENIQNQKAAHDHTINFCLAGMSGLAP